MAGNDLIGPLRKGNGEPAGMLVRAGDVFFSSPAVSASEPLQVTGPVLTAKDPSTGTIRYFRIVVQLVDDGEGGYDPVTGTEEVFL